LFSITPVPAHDVLHLSAKNGLLDKGTVKLYDLSGALMLSQDVSAVQRTELDVQSLESGLYIVRYDSKSGSLAQKVVVAH
jgi:hypothetical protein